MTDSKRISSEQGGESIPAALAAKPARRLRPGKHATDLALSEPVGVPIEADIAAITLVTAPAAEPVEVPHPTAAAPAESIQKEEAMATTTETVTQTANETMNKGAQVLTDMTGRAKGAMERGTKLFDEMNTLGKGNVEALVESGRIAAKGMESLVQEAADYARRSFETATANFRSLATVKSPTDLMKLQADYTRSAFDQAVAETSRSTEMMMKLAGEIVQPISNRFAVVADRIKTAA